MHVRTWARLRLRHIVASAIRVWLSRSLQIHAIAALCLAPLVLSPESGDPFTNGRILGLFGLYPAAWAVPSDLLEPRAGFLLDVILAYLVQFAVTVILVRHAHRGLAGRAPRSRPLAILGLVLLALGGLALFGALDSVVVAASESSSALPVLLFIPVTVAEMFIAATCWLALPAAAVDGRGVFSALGRGRLLAHGSGFTVFVLIVVSFFLQWIMVIPCGILIGALDADGLFKWLFAVPAILSVPLKACLLAAAYHEACLRKEFPRADKIGAVFA